MVLIKISDEKMVEMKIRTIDEVIEPEVVDEGFKWRAQESKYNEEHDEILFFMLDTLKNIVTQFK